LSLITAPTPGEDVHILAPHTARLRGQVTRRGPESLTVELEQAVAARPFRFIPGSEVSVEWVHPLGLMQLAAKVEEDLLEPRPTLRLGVAGVAARVERREYARVPIELGVVAWTLAQPSRRLVGKTVDLSAGGALLSLPDLSPFVAALELMIVLPGKPLDASARVAWRRDPALVGVEFSLIDPAERARLVELLGAR
jgi:hypothetical protein